MNRLPFLSVLFVLCLLGIGCQNKVDNLKEYYQYINATEHGLTKEKRIGDIKFTLKYWPTEAVLQQHNDSSISKDSLRQLYTNSLTFLLRIEASEQATQSFDVMTETVSSLQEFKEQALAMNFKWQELLSIQVGEKAVAPVLAVLENTYGLQQHRLVNIVFAKETCEVNGALPEKLDVVFKDEFFGTGKHHFVFKNKDLEAVPLLEL